MVVQFGIFFEEAGGGVLEDYLVIQWRVEALLQRLALLHEI